MNNIPCELYLIAPGYPKVVLRQNYESNWIVYFEHESYRLATYDGWALSPEDAFEKFFRYRILGRMNESILTNRVFPLSKDDHYG